MVELGNRSHDRLQRDAFVDSVLASAGLPILHVRWQRHYDLATLPSRSPARLGSALNLPLPNCLFRPLHL